VFEYFTHYHHEYTFLFFQQDIVQCMYLLFLDSVITHFSDLILMPIFD